ncbi:MAG: hypothetical protein U0793_18420 [Gemmataceae bacterium]
MAEDISLDQVPEKARHLLAVIKAFGRDPFVERHFYQVTQMSLNTSLGEKAEFFALEFRVGKNAVLIWNDAQGRWRAGKWLTLPVEQAALTSAAGFGADYFNGVYDYGAFEEALRFTAATIPVSGAS